jgi:hypothetical protein
MAVASASNPEFRIGEVIGQSFQTTIRNIIPFGIIAIIAFVVIGLLIMLMASVFGLSMPMGPGAMQPGAEVPSFGAGFFIGVIIAGLIAFAIYLGLMAAITYGTVQDLRGQPVSIGGLLQSAITLIPPAIGTLIALIGVFLVAMVVAMILAFIPILGVIVDAVMFVFLYIIFWVVIPVAVVERPGPVASLKRSIELTKGNRWRILGIVLLLFLISIGVSIIGMVFGFLGPIVGGIIQTVLNALIGIFSAVLIAVGYFRLRAAKEGVDIADIARVFD